MKLTKGLKLVMQMHYHPGAMPETDSTKVELRASKTVPSWEAQIQLIGNATSAPRLLAGPNDPATGPRFLIPANVPNHTEEMLFSIPSIPLDVRIAGVSPHMHWAGRELEVHIERPAATEADPASECLINAPNYDFNWQRGYAYDASINELPRLTSASKIRIKCTYDNTMGNRRVAAALTDAKKTQPSDINLGEDTFDEMCLAGFTLYTKMR